MRSPFKFLDAYTAADTEAFFGREEEVAALYEMTRKNRLCLIYGPSGTGKTSLVQCGLAGRFDATDWYPLFVRRQEDINKSLQATLARELGRDDAGGSPAAAVNELYLESLRPAYLIFDQLEELLILGSQEEQKQFVAAIAAILEAQLPCRILFILREEYLAYLYHFEKAIPKLFTRRLRIEPMSRSNLEEVVVRSCSAFNIRFEDPGQGPGQVIDNVSRGKAGISLPYLQVYLDMLYQADFQAAFKRQREGEELPPLFFSKQEIARLGAIENVLEKFLNEQQQAIQRQLRQHFPEIPEDTTQQAIDVFTSEEGTKRPLRFHIEEGFIQVDDKAYPFLSGLPPAARTQCLRALEQSRIIKDTGNTLELAHDSLAALIDNARTDEQRQLNALRRRLNNAFAEYQATGLLLSRKQLNSMEALLPRLEPGMESPVLSYLRESYRAAEEQEQAELEAERRKRRQAWRAAITGFTLAAVAIVALAAALHQGRIARQARLQTLEKAFEAQLKAAEVLKVSGRYPMALEQLSQAETFANTPAEAELVKQKQTGWRQARQFMARGDSLRQLQQLRGAIEQYQAARAASPDAFIESTIDKTQAELNTLFDELLFRANAMYTAGGQNARAIENYRKALELKPEDPRAREGLEKALRKK